MNYTNQQKKYMIWISWVDTRQYKNLYSLFILIAIVLLSLELIIIMTCIEYKKYGKKTIIILSNNPQNTSFE